MVTRGGVVNVMISPAGSSVTAGAPKTYSATASDAYGNSWDVTSFTTWSITSDAGGSWSGNVFTSAVAGSWTVSATYAAIAYTTGLTVNPAGLDHFTFDTITPQITGSPFNITITAKDMFNNTATGYTGRPSLTYSSGSISPATVDAFVGGVGSTSVTVNVAGSNVTIKATDNAHLGTSNSFSVNPAISASAGAGGAINPTGNVNVNYSGSQSFNITANTGYSIADVIADNISLGPVSTYTFTGVQATHTITAIFAINTFNISVSFGAGGSISPGGSVSINYGDNQTFNITTSADYYIVDVLVNASSVGAVNSYTFTNIQTPNTISAIFAPTPTPTPSPTTTQNTAPAQTPKPTDTPTQTPSPTPSPTPLPTAVPANADNGATVELAITGNITSSQISNATITTNQTTKTTTVTFTITGQNGTVGLGNMTIPKTAIQYGTTPVIYIDDQQAPNQGYTQDTNNFYVWYTTQFSTHQMAIQFTVPSTSKASSSLSMFAVLLTVPEIVLIYTVIAIRRLKRKPENT
jgi:cell division septation protein DedD